VAGGVLVKFGSWLAPQFSRFVNLKRACGAAYTAQEVVLARFDRFVSECAPKPPLRRAMVVRYLASLDRLFSRSRENEISVMWSALAYAHRHGAPVELPPRPPAPSASVRKRPPRVVSKTEFTRIFAATYKMEPVSELRSATTRTLLGLLFTTGIRIGEACALDVGDLDADRRLLTIRRGKFGKIRVLPVRESTVTALLHYIEHPGRRVETSSSMPLFVSGWKRRLAHACANYNLRAACRIAAITAPYPRLHDLRHSFVVSRVASWYEQGRDVDALLPVLSTYLGHVSVENTRTYLSANGLLLERAVKLFAKKIGALDKVQP
jgi:integrase